MTELFQAIEDLLKVKGITHDAFARSLGLDPGSWSRKRHGETKLTKPDLDAMVRVYPELKVPVWRSIGVDGPAPAPESQPAAVEK